MLQETKQEGNPFSVAVASEDLKITKVESYNADYMLNVKKVASFSDAYDREEQGQSTVKKRDRFFDSNSLQSEEQLQRQLSSNFSNEFRLQLDFSNCDKLFPDEDPNKAH